MGLVFLTLLPVAKRIHENTGGQKGVSTQRGRATRANAPASTLLPTSNGEFVPTVDRGGEARKRSAGERLLQQRDLRVVTRGPPSAHPPGWPPRLPSCRPISNARVPMEPDATRGNGPDVLGIVSIDLLEPITDAGHRSCESGPRKEIGLHQRCNPLRREMKLKVPGAGADTRRAFDGREDGRESRNGAAGGGNSGQVAGIGLQQDSGTVAEETARQGPEPHQRRPIRRRASAEGSRSHPGRMAG